jgi:glycosyltransferase involved in cell wall biosynthesis
MDNPVVSIIVPIYNRKDLLSETADSVLAQTFTNWELILIDDGSDDGSADIAAQYSVKDSRIKFLKRDRMPKGASVCRNIGLAAARGEYIIFLDSDDLLAAYCIERRLKYISDNPDQDFWIFPMLLFRLHPDDMRILQNVSTAEDPLDRFLKRENVWLMSSPIWRKSSLEKIGGFNENYLSFQDWEINTRALISGLKCSYAVNAVPDNFYRQHNGHNISNTRFTAQHNSSNARMIICTWEILKEYSKENEERRRALAGFFSTIILRYRYTDKQYFSETELYLTNAENIQLITLIERVKIKIWFWLQTQKIAYYSHFYRYLVQKVFQRVILNSIFQNYQSNQLKHRFHGKLA